MSFGVHLGAMSPWPSRPKPPYPNEYTSPPAPSTKLWESPAATAHTRTHSHVRQHLRRQLVQPQLVRRGGCGALGLGRRSDARGGGDARGEEVGDVVAEGEASGDVVGGERGGGAQR
eukprot:1498703-Prymnesium_polylepis.1